MKRHFNALLQFFRLTDPHDGLISLTNVQLLVVLAKLAVAPAVGFAEIGALFVTLASFQGKKLINQHQDSSIEDALSPIKAQLEETTEKLKDVQSQASAMALKVGLMPKGK